ncbi:TetR/AcrR family transcriptional regulator [Campylobacter sp. B0100352/1]|uniref:TetR/AcrR family transcriptional regulator n=1 Tax=Campylobacter sp. B0100352/1 TaxID=2735783 RepID=UPI001DF6415B|nr:TetR/AcrR family transcriptional regulator [Campylobacter sp. B0100352/1]
MNSNKILSKKNLARKDKIKKVACELFLARGFQETSLSDIIKISGGSYSNIYDCFQSKEGLFFEILDDVCKKHFDLIASQIHISENKNLKENLISFAKVFVNIYNTAPMVSLGKIIFSQVYNTAYLQNWIQDNQKFFARNILANLFSKQKNKYICDNAAKLAITFCNMLKEPYYTLNVLVDSPLMNNKEQEEHIEFMVDLFLNGISNKT